MVKHKRVLYLLFDGLLDTVIESQVLMLAKDVKLQKIADFEIWVVVWSRKLYQQAKGKQRDAERTANADIKIIRGLRPGIPLSGVINLILLYLKVCSRASEFSHIHGRSDYAGMLAALLGKMTNIVSIWDCRGNSQAEIRASNSKSNIYSRTVLKIKLLRAKIAWFIAAKYSVRTSFVTKSLYEKYSSYLSHKNVVIIPCLGSSDIFDYKPTLRKEMRESLAINEHEEVFVYSGSLASYQCFDEMLDCFQGIKKNYSNAKLLVLTPYLDSAIKKGSEKNIKDVIYKSAMLEEINNYLNAADYAFMLREHNDINNCAFPTKFIEYGLTGLPVIMNDSVPDCYDFAKKNKNLIEYNKNNMIINESYEREEISNNYKNTLTRESFMNSYKRLYS
jgi:glycosyltransferase involved in cell wall biosynthesis